MNIFSGVVVYVLTWWVVFFCLLPFGIQPENNPQLGNQPGAPINPRIKQKMLWTTLISIVVWFGIYLIIRSDFISFRAMAQRMSM